MTEVTEICSVRGEADIGDGALDYSDSLATRAAVETDAAARCRAGRAGAGRPPGNAAFSTGARSR